jgi:ATP-binding cassette subfamily C (CFTR/MRP) protein 1
MNLKNLDLEIKSGEFVCIVGDVGSGKTSLLNALIGDMMYVSDE